MHNLAGFAILLLLSLGLKKCAGSDLNTIVNSTAGARIHNSENGKSRQSNLLSKVIEAMILTMKCYV